MGRSNAIEMLCFGKKIDANEAKARNLVTQIYPHRTFQQNAMVNISIPLLTYLKHYQIVTNYSYVL